MKEYPFHPAAELTPLLVGDDLRKLTESIRRFGLERPIVLLDGMILDGRNRYRACREAGIEGELQDVDLRGKSPVEYVITANLSRLHMNPSQLAMVSARAREWFDAEAKKRQEEAIKARDEKGRAKPLVATLPQGFETGKSRDQAAALTGVCGRTVDKATRVLKSGIADLVSSVDAGRISVSAAAKLLPALKETKKRKAGIANRANSKPKRTAAVRTRPGGQQYFYFSFPVENPEQAARVMAREFPREFLRACLAEMLRIMQEQDHVEPSS